MLAAGLVSRRSLARDYRAIHRDVYLPRDCDLTPALKAKAAFIWSGGTATVAGLSAAALLGCRWIDVHHPAELVRRNGKRVTASSSTAPNFTTTRYAASPESR